MCGDIFSRKLRRSWIRCRWKQLWRKYLSRILKDEFLQCAFKRLAKIIFNLHRYKFSDHSDLRLSIIRLKSPLVMSFDFNSSKWCWNMTMILIWMQALQTTPCKGISSDPFRTVQFHQRGEGKERWSASDTQWHTRGQIKRLLKTIAEKLHCLLATRTVTLTTLDKRKSNSVKIQK